MSNWSDTLAVFDLETTGIDVETSRIVSATVAVIDVSGAVVERIDWLLDPGIEIPEQATNVHGITTAQAVANGRAAGEGVTEIVATIRELLSRGLPIVAYNAPYDLSLLNREAIRYGVAPLVSPSPVVDPLVIDKQVDRYRKGKRTLEVTSAYYGVSLDDAHDAGADAIAAGRVAQAIAKAHVAVLPGTVAELHELQVQWSMQQAERFQDYMRRERDPKFVASGAWPER
ncbi:MULTISPECIES: exonuclease domain-containing protein [Cryobacterium]|uniref:3'-5' exonuclease n=1 Tax=Cryobacterium glucosi TaxID=1259175 RepID=A0ABY2IQR3_9MICO|nr:MULTISPECIES: exonuclease domain-containing protein [Cryobacterium]MDY7527811.1 exonuclease domain-containing protein [Cryobacterium sp. 10C2]MEB0003711.1 exonuclease domain-containing protein [Cryobacterium sp. RTC2.1]MEB0200160.1 exonuclease domain-containing protein [Cryobacterium sp. 5I3]MEB0285062.1 exonuclease domain-containing protein [Cryobacterium sp. 10S3]MEB0289119.1 exonuclease domain-containing protein [Cryobacterium sp. 10C2]